MHKLRPNLIVAVILAGLLSFSQSATAQEEKKTRKTKETVAMSQQVYEKLTEIQELVETKDYATAQKLISDVISGKKKLSDYERAQVFNLSGYSYYLQEDFEGAIRAYDQVLAVPDLPEAAKMLARLTEKAAGDPLLGYDVSTPCPHGHGGTAPASSFT